MLRQRFESGRIFGADFLVDIQLFQNPGKLYAIGTQPDVGAVIFPFGSCDVDCVI